MQVDEIISLISNKINQNLNILKQSQRGHEWYMLEAGISLFAAKCVLEEFQKAYKDAELQDPKATLLQDLFWFLTIRMKLIKRSHSGYGVHTDSPANQLGLFLAELIRSELGDTVHMAQLLNPDLLTYSPYFQQANTLFIKKFSRTTESSFISEDEFKLRLQDHLLKLITGTVPAQDKARFIELLQFCPLMHWKFIFKALDAHIPLFMNAREKTWQVQLAEIEPQDEEGLRIEMLLILHQYIKELKARKSDYGEHLLSSLGYSKADKLKAAKLFRVFLLSGYQLSYFSSYLQIKDNIFLAKAVKQGELSKIHDKLIELLAKTKEQHQDLESGYMMPK